MEIVERLLHGDRRAAARLITMIENQAPGVKDALRQLHGHTGKAHIIGTTGPPGAGKSSLVGQLGRAFRSQGHEKVGIIAVDPTSPFTGGALLGDRVRMQDISNDPGVFIRSMATRGSLGGLARATNDAIQVLDAFGCDPVLVETVGAGQAEVDIAQAAHTTIVVSVPGMGDEIQSAKAGILEIADILVVNKADREGADRAVAELEMMLNLDSRPRAWTPPVIRTVATENKGVFELMEAIANHWAYLQRTGSLQDHLHRNSRQHLLDIIEEELLSRLLRETTEAELDGLVRRIADRELDPYTAAEMLLGRASA